jgi:predicted nucleic acid-binding protein
VGIGDLRGVEARGIRTYACAVAWAEVHAGVRPGEEALTQSFLEQRAEVVIDADTGWRASQYLVRYAKSHGLELADALVTAAATSSGQSLWTQNHRDYPVPDLRFHTPA